MTHENPPTNIETKAEKKAFVGFEAVAIGQANPRLPHASVDDAAPESGDTVPSSKNDRCGR
jgi:hypothetical protein